MGIFDFNQKIIILGCPRSGTKFISEIFNINGIQIGHEKMGSFGISSWCLVSGDDKVCHGPSYEKVLNIFGNNSLIYHQVRNPLQTISSLTTISKKSFDFVKNYIPMDSKESLNLKCMKFWYYWNLMAEKLTTNRYRIEDVDFLLPNFKGLNQKNINSRRHVNLNWDDLRMENEELANNIKVLSERYGY